MPVTITPMAGFGGRIGSLNVHSLTTAERTELNEALAQHGVLVAHGLQLDPHEQVELTCVFGEPEIHPIESIRLPGVPEVIELKVDLTDQVDPDDPASGVVVGDIAWHSDLTYTVEPSRGSLLYAVDVPAEGGDTGFVDSARVYAAMPEDLRHRIEGLEVVHSLGRRTETQLKKAANELELKRAVTEPATSADSAAPMFPEVVHPIVHRHPVSGQPVLNISPMFARSIVGWSDAESRALLDELTEFATQARFTYFHRWSVGDLVIWDNWRTMHIATGHPKRYRRRMLRTTIYGGVPLIAA